MIKKILRGSSFFGLGLLIEILVVFIRYIGLDYLKLLIFLPLYFLSGLIISRFETKVVFNPLLFLLPSLYVFIYASFDNSPAIIRWIAELITLLPSFFLGFYFLRFKSNIRLPIALGWLAIYGCFIFLINPQLIFRMHSNAQINKILAAKKIDYQFINSDSSIISSIMMENKVVLLDYWFIGCGPCYMKMYDLKKIAIHFKGRKNFSILVVDAGFRDSFENFLKISKKFPKELTYAYDPGGKISSSLNITSYPYEILFDKNGIIRHQIVGFNTDLSLTYTKNTIQKIETLLNEK